MRINRFTNYVALVALVVMSLASSIADAVTFHRGNIPGNDVMFMNVTENNSELSSLFAPMPGTGGLIASGNSLQLDPQNFAS